MTLADLTQPEFHAVWVDRSALAEKIIAHPDREAIPYSVMNLIVEWTVEPLKESERRTDALWADIRTMWDPAPADLEDRAIAAIRAELGGGA